jgi:hypothetical protein
MTDRPNSTATGGDPSTHYNRTEEDNYIPAPRKSRSGNKQWVTVEATSLEELAAKIDALCDLLIPEQRRKPE